ncbi:MAG: PQQ-binding-like beta-propeller repeat protein [Solirubrobacterales bacterium]
MDTEEKISAFVWIQVAMATLVQVLLVVFVVGFIIGHYFIGSDKVVEVTPNGEEISFGTPPPMSSWAAPNGDQYNHRVANSEIDSENVKELGVAWTLPITATLKGTYVPAAKFGYFASTPVIDEKGVVYFQDADSNVFAVNLKTGQEIWKKEFNLPNEGPNGVTYVDGAVYGCSSSFCFSLDAKTGEEIWKTERLTITEAEGKAQFPAAEAANASVDTSIGITAKGQGINFAPQVHNGRVFVSTSGQITGGEAIALDAATGEVLWKTNETKDPADRVVGGVAGTGGSWNAPAIGPEGTVYYGIGNPYRTDEQAIETPTELLYNDSTIAVDPESGRVEWYMQGVPNDFYDWDMQISPVYSEETGKDIVLDAGKMGFVYAMDPNSGELLWKTPVGTHNGHDEDGQLALEGKYHPTTYPYKVYPGTLGGVETNMAVDEGVAYVVTVNSYQERPDPNTTLGGGQSLEDSDGDIVAIDVASGEKIWEEKLPGVPFGAATISNDMVFTTLYDGTVVGVSRKNGQILWEEKLPGGSNSPLVIEGDTLIAINSVPAGDEGPQIVAYRLGASAEAEEREAEEKEEAEAEGEQPAGKEGGEEAGPVGEPEEGGSEVAGEEEEEGAAEGEGGGEEEEASEEGGGEEALLTEGKTAFTTNCASCHTLSEAGTTGSVGPNLDDLKPDKATVEKQVINGGGGMPAFGGLLSEEEIKAISEYVSKAAGTGNDALGGESTGGGGGV